MAADDAFDRSETGDCGCGGACGPGGAGGNNRRDFLKLAAATGAWLAAGGQRQIAAAEGLAPDHFVPVEKNLDPRWLKSLTAKGESQWYAGDELETIAMPVGGICTGQVYLSGDGRLTHWDVFNGLNFTGYGLKNYQNPAKPVAALAQGFAVEVRQDGKTQVRTLDREGFPNVRFRGEYPIGFVDYADKAFPLAVSLEAFSPFIPLNAADSALPATLMCFTLKNTSARPLEVTIAGLLENGVCRFSGQWASGVRTNRVISGDGLTMVFGGARATTPEKPPREPIVLADFEKNDYAGWTVEGEAFGKGPARGTLAGQQVVSGFQGKGLVNTFVGGDEPHGRLLSPTFTIERNCISLLVGGGNQAGKTCVNLLVEGKAVRTAVGQNKERLAWHTWDVKDLAGKQAQIEIVDAASGPWGHVNVDQIELRDTPRAAHEGPLDKAPDFGTMAIAVLGEGGYGHRHVPMRDGVPDLKVALEGSEAMESPPGVAEAPLNEPSTMAVGRRLSLAPGATAAVTFVLAWHMPNRPDRGNFYATRLVDAQAVVEYIAKNLDRLAGQTRLWHATWYDSSLPHWLLDRLFSTTSTLATGTCQWWANGRFWAWEGVGCCHGTCAHVWNYEHTMARLFPELERSVREMQDFEPSAGFDAETGAVRFRGENWKQWAGDSQGGTLLKALREHQCSSDVAFLKRNWPRIRKSLEFLIAEDGNADGLLEGKQHNTYDIDFYGANTMVGSLYLAALRAGEEMAREMGDEDFARQCQRIFKIGSRLSVEKLFNGEYFVQTVDLAKHAKHQYGDGCLADQLFGQGWAHQVGLGYVYPAETVKAAVGSLWKYNWAPDVGPQNAAHPPERWFARPGEAGLFTCTWPKSKHLGPDSVRYRDEVWTGIEYQVAGHMAWEGMVTEALAVCRGIHDRYHPAKHNPFNEVECGDHYARGMASYGVFLALCGFEYHGPAGLIGFAPRLTPERFRAAFSGAEGWGTIEQTREAQRQTARIELRSGRLRIKTLAFELPEGATLGTVDVTLAGKPVASTAEQDGRRVRVRLDEAATVSTGESLTVVMNTRAAG